MPRLPLLAAVLLAACANDAVAPNGSAATFDDVRAPFRTDSLAYTMRSEQIGRAAMVVATYVNDTGRPTYFVNCLGGTGVVLEKRVAGRWVGVWSPVLPDCLSAPIVVPPGGTHEFPVELFDGDRDRNVAPRFTVTDIPGTYRLVWTAAQGTYAGGPDARAVLPLAARVSNDFTLDVAR